MQIKYLGPGDWVNVAPYGQHTKDRVKDYPDDFGAELLATSRRQKFEAAEDDDVIAKTPPLDEMTVPQLRDLLGKLGVDIPAGSKKADLIALVMKNTAEPPAED